MTQPAARSGRPTSIGIIGGTGRMGGLFRRLFEAQGYQVRVAGHSDDPTYGGLVTASDVVIVTAPIADTVAVIGRIGPHLRAGQLLSDFTSIKVEPVRAMLATPACVIGAHPLFAPMPSPRGQNVVLCPARPGPYLEWYRDFLSQQGMTVVVLTAEAHDEAMAFIQGLTHFINIVFARTLQTRGARLEQILQVCSPVYQVLFAILCRILSGDAHLYGQIQASNPNNPPVLVLDEATSSLDNEAERRGQEARDRLKASGYDGTRVVLMKPTDLAAIQKLPDVAAQLMRQAGFKVDLQAMDWQTLVSRRAKKDPPAQGGWNMFCTAWVAPDIWSPLSNAALDTKGEKASWFGWPDDPKIEQLKAQFARELERRLEVRFGLAREADDEVGRQAEVRPRLAQAPDDRAVLEHRVAALHRREHPTRARLHRKVDLGDQLRQLRVRVDQALRELARVGGRVADALDAVHAGHVREEQREVRRLAVAAGGTARRQRQRAYGACAFGSRRWGLCGRGDAFVRRSPPARHLGQ